MATASVLATPLPARRLRSPNRPFQQALPIWKCLWACRARPWQAFTAQRVGHVALPLPGAVSTGACYDVLRLWVTTGMCRCAGGTAADRCVRRSMAPATCWPLRRSPHSARLCASTGRRGHRKFSVGLCSSAANPLICKERHPTFSPQNATFCSIVATTAFLRPYPLLFFFSF